MAHITLAIGRPADAWGIAVGRRTTLSRAERVDSAPGHRSDDEEPDLPSAGRRYARVDRPPRCPHSHPCQTALESWTI